MLSVVLNKSGKQHPIKEQLWEHLPPISQTIKIRQDMLGIASKVRMNSLVDSHTHTRVGQLARTYISSVQTLDTV